MRHKSVLKCEIGSLGLYLFARFHIAKESLNFDENKNWFKVKLVVKSGSKNTEDGVGDQVYARSIRKVCEELQVIPKHFIHLGRSTGAIAAELCELTADETRLLGNGVPTLW
jgi:hypothetical protein